MAYEQKRGWFSRANGYPVTKHGGGLPLTSWTYGYPRAVLFHYTAGCGADIHGTLVERDISVTFSVDREGGIHQYARFGAACWHAYGMSHYAVGIEHTADPGKCDLTPIQLKVSAALSAAILEFVKKRHGFEIPLAKLSAPVTLDNVRPGFFDHRDGTPDWNENGHTDHLYGETWNTYLAAVKDFLVPALRLEVIGVKGEHRRERTVGAMQRALALVRRWLRAGFRVHVRSKGPAAGPEG